MRTRSRLSWFVLFGAVGACNAIFGMEELEEGPPGGSSGDAGDGGGGTAGSGKGGSSGSGKGGTSGSSGSAGTSGEAGGGMGGGGGDCEPEEETSCGEVYAVLGNCRDGRVVCDANGNWGECSVTPEDADSCETEGDDADCDGTANEGCPCLDGAMRNCGPDTDDGICEFGTQTCVEGMWGDCEGAVLPEARDCLSTADNDCDGVVDNARDDECPCAVDGAHVCVEDAPPDWEGPMAIATAAATASSPSCTGTGYERQVLTKFGAIDMGTATCGCACGAPAHSCGPINMQRGSVSCFQLTTVVSAVEYPNMAPSTCINVTGSGQNFYPTSNYTAGMCPPQPTSNFVRARFTERVTGCETNDASPAGCAAASQCVPALDNPLDSFCIYRDGDHACPSGPFSARTLYYDTLDDPRSCTTCSCGVSTGSCTGRVTFVQQPCPGQIAVDTLNYGACATIDSGGIAMAATPTTPTPNGTCAPSGGAVQGAVTTAGPVTVCCKP